MKKKLITLLLTALACFCTAFAFVGCKPKYKVTFMVDGKQYQVQKVNSMMDVQLPLLPDEDCGEFGWYLNNTKIDNLLFLPDRNYVLERKFEFDYSLFTFEQNSPDAYSLTGLSETGKSNVKKLIIPDTYNNLPVTRIEKEAFEDNINLTSVTIPESITSIGDSAFQNCTGLTGVYYTGAIDGWAMMEFECDDEFWGSNPLQHAERLYIRGVEVTQINFTTATYISDRAFLYCLSVKDVVIGNSVQKMGDYAFRACENLENVTMGSGVIDLSLISLRTMFYQCDNLKNIMVNENNATYRSIDGNLYSKDGKTLLIYAIGKTETEFIVPDSVAKIEKGAFFNTRLKSIILGNHIQSIGSATFYNCPNLETVTIPDSVLSIDSSAFYDCPNLKNLSIPDSVQSISSWAFYACGNLTDITVSENNTAYKSIDGNLYTKDGKTLVQYATGKTDTAFTVPASVQSIGKGAFWGSGNLTTVTIGDGVQSIGNSAFV